MTQIDEMFAPYNQEPMPELLAKGCVLITLKVSDLPADTDWNAYARRVQELLKADADLCINSVEYDGNELDEYEGELEPSQIRFIQEKRAKLKRFFE